MVLHFKDLWRRTGLFPIITQTQSFVELIKGRYWRDRHALGCCSNVQVQFLSTSLNLCAPADDSQVTAQHATGVAPV